MGGKKQPFKPLPQSQHQRIKNMGFHIIIFDSPCINNYVHIMYIVRDLQVEKDLSRNVCM